ncbi:MAG: hypothetical protein M3O67_04765 [Bacteroidota bacterium]|nr:hypothetical protein [Bacteroidota bacterium]
MLSIFYFHIIITAVCSLAGLLFYQVILKDKNAENKPLIFYPITGLIFITLINQLAVLFIPITKYFSFCFLVILFLLAIIKRNRVLFFYKNTVILFKKLPVIALLLIGILWLMILVLSAGPTMMDDTESYHIQMIKWITGYGTVPGIVNLHNRFGFNSSWFTTISFFLPGAGRLNFYTMLNGVISLWLCSFFIGQIYPLLNLKNNKPVSAIDISVCLLLLLSLFCWPMIRGNAATANYDFITTVLILVLFIKTLQEGNKITTNKFTAEWIIWPVYLFTIRIINFPLLLLSIYGLYSLLKDKEWKRIGIFFIVSICLIGCFVARNVLLAGYPFYPATTLNIFKVDWKADSNMIRELLDYIKYYNRVNVMYMDVSSTKQLSLTEWPIEWFRYLFTYDKPVVITGILGFLINFSFRKSFFKNFNPLSRFFLLVLSFQFISWFWIAPDPRFVYGGLLCGIMILLIFFLKNKNYDIKHTSSGYFFIIVFACVFFYTILKLGKDKNYQNFLLPYRLPQPPTKEIIIDNISLKIPEKILNNWNPRCYATDVPCLYIINPKLRARGNTIQNGFRLEK